MPQGLVYLSTQRFSSVSSGSLWEMPDSNPEPLPQKSAVLPMNHRISIICLIYLYVYSILHFFLSFVIGLFCWPQSALLGEAWRDLSPEHQYLQLPAQPAAAPRGHRGRGWPGPRPEQVENNARQTYLQLPARQVAAPCGHRGRGWPGPRPEQVDNSLLKNQYLQLPAQPVATPAGHSGRGRPRPGPEQVDNSAP